VLTVLAHGTFGHRALDDWSFDPITMLVATALIVSYVNGWHPRRDGTRRAMAFGGGVVTGLVAVVSPIHVAAEESLSWHMAQHVMLIGVCAPLIALAAPAAALQRGLGRRIAGLTRRARRRSGMSADRMRRFRSPLARWLVFVVVFWGWHTTRLYTAAVRHETVHALEHVTFVAAALLVWSTVLGPSRAAGNADPIMRVLVVFLLGLQGVLLSVLMVFSRQPWYPVYESGPGDPLADQHLAGALMWIPLGVLYAATGIWAVMALIGPDD